MKNTHNTDQLFRDSARRYREKPPGEAWALIDAALNRGRRRRAFILLSGAAAVIILLLGFGAGYLYRSLSEINDVVVETEQIQNMNPENSNIEVAQIETDEADAIVNADVVSVKPVTAQQRDISQIENRKPSSDRKAVEEQPISTVLVQEPVVTEQAVVEEPAEAAVENVIMEEQEDELTQAQKEIQLRQMLTETDNSVNNTTLPGYGNRNIEPIPDKPDLYSQSWSVGGDITAAYAYRNTPASDQEFKDRSPIAEEQGVASWNAGVYATKEVAGAVSVKTGVTYASYGQASQNLYAFQEGPSFSVNSSSGNISTGMSADYDESKPLSNVSMFAEPQRILLDNTELLSDYGLSDPDLMVVQRFDYLEIPFVLQFSPARKRGFSVITEAGIYAGVLTGNKAFLTSLNSKYLIGSTENLRPFSLGGVAGAGAKYRITDSFSAMVMPEIRYSFFSISKQPDIEYHPYQFGLGLGLTYHF
jgi:hypothetical protein